MANTTTPSYSNHSTHRACSRELRSNTHSLNELSHLYTQLESVKEKGKRTVVSITEEEELLKRKREALEADERALNARRDTLEADFQAKFKVGV